jgi:small redox-active disulfide protein 2
MALFGFGKKKEEKETPCCGCGTTQTSDVCCSPETDNSCCGEKTDGICCIKVLGAGCKSCHEQYENVKKAVSEMGLNVEVEYITDMEKVMSYGVMSMPAIVVNEKVVAMGKVMKSADVVKLLKK